MEKPGRGGLAVVRPESRIPGEFNIPVFLRCRVYR
jgi:hypothetical protein